MPLINRLPATNAKKAVTIRMPVEIIDTLHDYARFLDSSLDHVVIEALRLVFKKDGESGHGKFSSRLRLLKLQQLPIRQQQHSRCSFPNTSAIAIAPQEKRAERVDRRNHAPRSVGTWDEMSD